MRCLAVIALSASALGAQDAWSPLRPLADMPRSLVSAAPTPGLLEGQGPLTGLLWSAGNPAGLGFGVTGSRADLSAQGSGVSGPFRRPLDPERRRITSFEGLGWGPVGRAAVVGRIHATQSQDARVAFNDMMDAHRSDPFIVADTVAADMRRVTARLEGGIGGAFGGWALGLAIGAELADGHSQNTGFPRLQRRSTPAATVGLARKIPMVGGRIAFAGRWQGDAETLRLLGLPQPGQAHIHAGFSEPDPISVVGPVGILFHRVDRRALAWSVALDGRLASTGWTAWMERGSRADEHRNQRQDPDLDVWRANGWTLGLALDRSFGAHLRWTATTRLASVVGNAVRADLPDADFLRSRERRFDIASQVRWMGPGGGWQAGLVVVATRDRRRVNDFLVPIVGETVSWRGGGGVELARRFGAFGLAAGFSAGSHAATGSLPDPAAMGPLFTRVIGAEWQTAVRQARPVAVRVVASRRVSQGVDLLLAGEWHRVTTAGTSPTLTLAADGGRRAMSLSVGVTISR